MTTTDLRGDPCLDTTSLASRSTSASTNERSESRDSRERTLWGRDGIRQGDDGGEGSVDENHRYVSLLSAHVELYVWFRACIA